jgi:circadian clock protein KaiB
MHQTGVAELTERDRVYMTDAEEADATGRYRLLRLVAGKTRRSRCAIQNVRRLCGEHLVGRVDLEIIDIRQRPELAREYQVVAVPMLLKLLPLPLRRIVGDLSDTVRLMEALELAAPAKETDTAA